MWNKPIIGILILFGALCSTAAMADTLAEVMEDIAATAAERGESGLEDLQEQLAELASHPMNLNTVSAEGLARLKFLNDEQIDAILLYAYRHPFRSTEELHLIPQLQDYEVRNLLPFVMVADTVVSPPIYFREVFQFAKHELTTRLDARNIEDYTNDPIYAKFRYRMNYQNRVQIGLTVCRPTGAEWQKMQYGGYVAVQDIGCLKSAVLGNFQASFGQGLVVGSPFHMGKSSYVLSTTVNQEGIRKFTSVGDDYHSFHGAGATARIKWADISVWYSLEKEDSIFHHALGANLTGRWNRLKVGFTLLEHLYSDTAKSSQAILGLNVRYHLNKVDMWGEVATTQGNRWGLGAITGVRFTPIPNIGLLALYRYYSPDFNNVYANAFSESSKLCDENGFYLGTEISSVSHWRFSAYADGFRGGYDALFQSDWNPAKAYSMSWKIRARRQDNSKDTYAFRYRFDWQEGNIRLRTQADVNGVKKEQFSYGLSLFQDIEYQFPTPAIVVQCRIQAFDARQWDNRIYAYENDVLYAYSIPNVYGLGMRFSLNMRYKITDVWSIYLRAIETLQEKNWAQAHDKKCTRTDLHILVRAKL